MDAAQHLVLNGLPSFELRIDHAAYIGFARKRSVPARPKERYAMADAKGKNRGVSEVLAA
jgi:hypothetical protein